MGRKGEVGVEMGGKRASRIVAPPFAKHLHTGNGLARKRLSIFVRKTMSDFDIHLGLFRCSNKKSAPRKRRGGDGRYRRIGGFGVRERLGIYRDEEAGSERRRGNKRSVFASEID